MRSFIQRCSPEWIVSPIFPDYGLDVRIELVRDGRVTGEEFAVQVKGGKFSRIRASGGVAVGIRQSTINYWLGKLFPVMIVAVDIESSTIWFDWLEYAYAKRKRKRDAPSNVKLTLKNKFTTAFATTVEQYVREWYDRVRRDLLRFSDRSEMTRLALEVTQLAQALARIQIQIGLKSGNEDDHDSDGLRKYLHFLLYGFTLWDSLLLSHFDEDSPWRRPLSPRFAKIIDSKVHRYIGLRGNFILWDQAKTKGDFDFVPFSWTKLAEFLLPTLDCLWDLESVLLPLLVLGRIQDASVIGVSGEPPPN